MVRGASVRLFHEARIWRSSMNRRTPSSAAAVKMYLPVLGICRKPVQRTEYDSVGPPSQGDFSPQRKSSVLSTRRIASDSNDLPRKYSPTSPGLSVPGETGWDFWAGG